MKRVVLTVHSLSEVVVLEDDLHDAAPVAHGVVFGGCIPVVGCVVAESGHLRKINDE